MFSYLLEIIVLIFYISFNFYYFKYLFFVVLVNYNDSAVQNISTDPLRNIKRL